MSKIRNYQLVADEDLRMLSNCFSRRDWREKGFCVSTDVLSSELILELRRRVEEIAIGNYETGREPLRYKPPIGSIQTNIEMYSHVHWCDGLIAHIAFNQNLAELAASLLGSNSVRLWGTSVICKYGSDSAVNNVKWHRDMTFWQCIDQPKLLTFWFALDDTTEENGCLEFAIASHLASSLNDANLAEHQSEVARMRQGQVSIHHCLTGHRSNSNKTNKPRRGLTIHYMDSNLMYIPGSVSDGHMNVFLLGKTSASNFDSPYFPVVYES